MDHRGSLIFYLTSGTMTRDMKEVCKRFECVTGRRVVVQERAGDSVKSTAKAEPLRNQSCGRIDCFPCTTGGGGKCEKNSSGYRIISFFSSSARLMERVLSMRERQQGMLIQDGLST